MPPPAADELLVAVGSTNPVKLRACERAFAKCFPSMRVTCYAVQGVRSGVPDQPLGMAQTTRGAVNRARHALKKAKATKAWAPHFAVGLEGGLVTSASGAARASSGSSSKSRASSDGPGLDCVAVMAVLERATGRTSTATAATFALPPLLARLVRGGMELGDADDVVFARTNSKQEDGTVLFSEEDDINLLKQNLVALADRFGYGVRFNLDQPSAPPAPPEPAARVTRSR